MSNYAKKNISTKQSPSCEEARIQSKNGDQKRSRSIKTSSCEGTKEINSSSLLNFRFPKENRLRKPSEFRQVYAEGKRFEGKFMTLFIMQSKTEFQRLGVTASKKATGKAHERFRAKRLLRESFRLSKAELNEVTCKYDWVLNARRSLLKVKLEKPLDEFRQLIKKVKVWEQTKGEENVGSEAK
jgi:ribonuclease P protein component